MIYYRYKLIFSANLKSKLLNIKQEQHSLKNIKITKTKIFIGLMLIIIVSFCYRTMTYHDVDLDTLLQGRWLPTDLSYESDFGLIYIRDTISYTKELEQKLREEYLNEYGDSLDKKSIYKTYDPQSRYLYVNHQKIAYLVYVSFDDIEILTFDRGIVKGRIPGSHW